MGRYSWDKVFKKDQVTFVEDTNFTWPILEYVPPVIDISRASNRKIVIKVLVQEVIISLISVYAPHYDLGDSQKDDSMIAFSVLLEVWGEGTCSYSGRFSCSCWK